MTDLLKVSLKAASIEDLQTIQKLFDFYLYDMSRFLGLEFQSGEGFLYPSDILMPYWRDQDHYPFIIYCEMNGVWEIAGFSLLRNFPENPQLYDIGQFFVLQKFVGKGVGRAAFEQSVAKFKGSWQVRVFECNTPAAKFWKKAINEYSAGEYQSEVKSYQGKEMLFYRFNSRIEVSP